MILLDRWWVRGFAAREICVDRRLFGVRTAIRDAGPRETAIVVVAHAPNRTAGRVLRACIRSLQANTPEDHAVWVVDTGSPRAHIRWLLRDPRVNVVLAEREPAANDRPCGAEPLRSVETAHAASYANGVALELALALIPDGTEYVFTAHQDVAACKPGWLSFLLSKVGGDVRAAGVRIDTARTPEGVLHVLGMLVHLPTLRRLALDFLPRLPALDAGDNVTVGLRREGFGVYGARNSLHDSDVVASLPDSSPYKELEVDRALDDAGDVFYLHLGRGTAKALGTYKPHDKASVHEYLRFVERHVLADRDVAPR